MFRKSKRSADDTSAQTSNGSELIKVGDESNLPVKHSLRKLLHPKVLLIDIASEAISILTEAGFNVKAGTFGSPYKVPISDGYRPVIVEPSLPNHSEQEIVVIDLIPPAPLDNPQEKETSPGTKALYAPCGRGLIDPRPIAMVQSSSAFEQILANGGVFIIFMDHRTEQKWIFTNVASYGDLRPGEEIDFNNYFFLPVLDNAHLAVDGEFGEEIFINKSILDWPIAQLLAQYISNTEYECTVAPSNDLELRWATLAHNKYDKPVAGVIFPNKYQKGWVFLLPQIKDKSGFLKRLFTDILPACAPYLFPDSEHGAWVEKEEYEHPSILQYRDEISMIQEEARQKIVEREEAIGQEREAHQYLHDLLTKHDDALVAAVKQALAVLGFIHVIDVDEEIAKSTEAKNKREDLQIFDISPTLLVEIKGKGGLPAENDALQIVKNINARMKEWNRTDVRGLSIINHQRYIAALQRQNDAPFQEDVVTTAEQSDIGLLTTWDLFRLVRSFQKNYWTHENVHGLFYENGHFEIVPAHYEYIGEVEKYYAKHSALSIVLHTGILRLHDRIAFELSVVFEEQDIDSLRLEGEPITEATGGQVIGVTTHLTKEQARPGIRVYRITNRMS